MHCGNGFNGNCVPDISCMHMNIRSLSDKFDKLKVILSSLELVNIRFDFILIRETFLSDRSHDLYNLTGYTFVTDTENTLNVEVLVNMFEVVLIILSGKICPLSRNSPLKVYLLKWLYLQDTMC